MHSSTHPCCWFDITKENILLGLMSHSSTHPCCWCDITKENIGNKEVSRTIQNMDLFWRFFDARAARKDGKMSTLFTRTCL